MKTHYKDVLKHYYKSKHCSYSVRKHIFRNFCSIIPSTEYKIIKRNNNTEQEAPENGQNDEDELRVNGVNIQMVSKNIYKQLFGDQSTSVNPDIMKQCQRALTKHGIDYKNCDRLPDVELTLPKLAGNDIEEHFYNIGEIQCAPYRELIKNIIKYGIPEPPKHWLMHPGWYCYKPNSSPVKVDYPPDEALVLDVEVLMSAGTHPTLACAVSQYSWYGWVSESLFDSSRMQKQHNILKYEELIPLESDKDGRPADIVLKPRIVIGHNVSYDRAKIKEQYWLNRTGVRFMDTMSMHVCVSGVTSYQRAVLKSKQKDPNEAESEQWMDIGSLNSLQEVHKLYCGTDIKKDPREIFVEGTMNDVIENFQYLMNYCCSDVRATYNVLVKLFPMFLDRFPHPVTMAGMLELGTAYLPVNANWIQYLEASETSFEDLKLETRQLLSMKADKACQLMNNDSYKQDLWMWDQDWSTQKLKLKKGAKVKKDGNYPVPPLGIEKKHYKMNKTEFTQVNDETIDNLCSDWNDFGGKNDDVNSTKFGYLYELGKMLPLKCPFLPGYPAWFRKLCTKPEKNEEWTPGAYNITTSMQITPKLLGLSWEGYPLHHIKDEGWGFLVPFTHRRPETYVSNDDEPQIPLKELLAKCPVVEFDIAAKEYESEIAMMQLNKNVERDIGKRMYYNSKKKDTTPSKYKGLGIWSGIELQGCCHFLKLPHKDGPKYKVGNPLARDFLDKFSQNVLTAGGNEAEKVLMFGRMMSYWRNNRQRILNQQVLWLPPEYTPDGIQDFGRKYGAILPQVVVCGTLTRRAMEATWMTASNAHSERIGSELRSMIQAPSNYVFVGADVDSQELWIASMLGDSSVGLIGGTALSWSVLAGTKQYQTDLHSLTARASNISRDHAKVINYARIYGAGQNFAERLLKQFNPTISNAEAKSKAMKMFKTTKGIRVYKLKPEYMKGFMESDTEMDSLEMNSYQATRLARLSGKTLNEMFERPVWVGGTESEMFNKLEEISEKEQASTAFLSGRLSRALENNEGRWAATRLNWAVQSAAADFLHLMLVNMRALNNERVRFSLSFHDEVRYLVPEENKYEASLALQLTNLFTRAFCAKRVGLNDLPMSVAFFTSVEIDKVLRKDSTMNCVTPSNPHGLDKGYNIPFGESLNIYDIVKIMNQKEKKYK